MFRDTTVSVMSVYNLSDELEQPGNAVVVHLTDVMIVKKIIGI
jgi:hypothetical protein